MNDPKNISAQAISVADQAFAEVNGDIDKLIVVLRKGMSEHPQYEHSPSLLWFRSVLDYRDSLEEVVGTSIERAIHRHTADMMIAAMFRLARQPDDEGEWMR